MNLEECNELVAQLIEATVQRKDWEKVTTLTAQMNTRLFDSYASLMKIISLIDAAPNRDDESTSYTAIMEQMLALAKEVTALKEIVYGEPED